MQAAASPNPKQDTPWRRRMLVGALLCALLAGSLFPLYGWQSTQRDRAQSLSNIRRIGQGALLYAQDWDARFMPIATQESGDRWRTWPSTLRPYVQGPDTVFSNPSNPIDPFHSRIKHPQYGYPIDSSFAFNQRFWNAFGSGPFPSDNLELPEQTVLFVEAGPMWTAPKRQGAPSDYALLDYGDTLDRTRGLVPYPSTHDGRMAVVAADGHGLLLSVEHYTDTEGPHDPHFGRIGQTIYNWNGGHPNGETDLAPRD